MSELKKFELQPCLKALVDRCVELGTTETHVLAESLLLSEETVNTYWKRIKLALEIQKRHEAVRLVRGGYIMIKRRSKSKSPLPDHPVANSPRIRFIAGNTFAKNRV
jgi:hypothetical protein